MKINNAFFPQIEKESPSDIAKYQDLRLQEALGYLKANSPFYRDLFKNQHIDINKIKTSADLVHIPVTTKDDLSGGMMIFFALPKPKL